MGRKIGVSHKKPREWAIFEFHRTFDLAMRSHRSEWTRVARELSRGNENGRWWCVRSIIYICGGGWKKRNLKTEVDRGRYFRSPFLNPKSEIGERSLLSILSFSLNRHLLLQVSLSFLFYSLFRISRIMLFVAWFTSSDDDVVIDASAYRIHALPWWD